MNDKIAGLIAKLPHGPGVYLMKDARGQIFYIGKAKSLRERVRGYFSGSDTRAFVALLDPLLADLEVVLTNSEKEAFLLENELIKAHQPRFNVKLTDDKRFLCLRLDVRKPTPRIEVTRRIARDGARYFGPFHSAHALRETLRIINRHFQLRTCTDRVLKQRTRPCLQHQIHRCPAPCVFDLTGGTYAANVRAVVAFLEGKNETLVADLMARMQALARGQQFEAAGLIRDQIRAVERSLERQQVIHGDLMDRDVVGVYREGPAVELHVMQVRAGRLCDAKRFSLGDTEVPTQEVLGEFAGRYYSASESPPNEILFPGPMQWAEPLSAILSERAGRRVQVLVPQRGNKLSLVKLACRNAAQAFADKKREAGAAKTATAGLQQGLHLRHLPQKIECYDISHIQGSQIVASAVAFENGVPVKSRYRRYSIRSTATQDDFQSMYEVIVRRVRRGLEHDDLPDLMVIDGGRGQVAAARAALDDHGVDQVDLIGLAKARSLENATPGTARRVHRGTASRPDATSHSPERVFVAGVKDPIVLRQNSAELFLLTRARDEAHRFALAFHRLKRRRAATHSQLDDIAGIGPKRRQALLRTFGSVGAVRGAELSALAEVVGEAAAKKLRDAFDAQAGAPADKADETAPAQE